MNLGTKEHFLLPVPNPGCAGSGIIPSSSIVPGPGPELRLD